MSAKESKGAWARHLGLPKMMRVDEAKGWASRALWGWASDHNVTLQVAPAECHFWLGADARKHQVTRKASEMDMDT